MVPPGEHSRSNLLVRARAGDVRAQNQLLTEYRNYIHPEKERRHGVVLALNDSTMFWSVTKALVRQLLLSASTP